MPTFEVGELVLCSHATGIFDARVLDVTPSSAGPVYLVHYLGWKKAWDEHVPERRLRRRTKENLAEKERVAAEIARTRRPVPKRKSAPAPAPSDDDADNARTASRARATAARKKLAADGRAVPTAERSRAAPVAKAAANELGADDEHGADAAALGMDGGGAANGADTAADTAAVDDPAAGGERAELLVQIPQPLKIRLVTDWEAITREHKLVPLPRTPSVSQILDEFCQAKARRSSHERLYAEIRAGVSAYFNQALGTSLLYRYERKQFDELAAHPVCAGRPMDEVYGAEHHLRLLVKLPTFLEGAAMDADQRIVLQAKLHELLKFVQKNQAAFFSTKHAAPPKEYLDWWEATGGGGGEHAKPAAAAAAGGGVAPAARHPAAARADAMVVASKAAAER